jgi:hypothetical protein
MTTMPAKHTIDSSIIPGPGQISSGFPLPTVALHMLSCHVILSYLRRVETRRDAPRGSMQTK